MSKIILPLLLPKINYEGRKYIIKSEICMNSLTPSRLDEDRTVPQINFQACGLGSVATISGFHFVRCCSDGLLLKVSGARGRSMIDFKGVQFPKAIILHAVFFYVRYSVSYRDLEEILQKRGVDVDHATLSRWVVKYSPQIAANAQARKWPTAVS
jgi:hypothetical protein